MSHKIAINGFGRIGRSFFRQAFYNDEVDVVAINDLVDEEKLVYLLKYDTVYGRFDEEVKKINKGDDVYLKVGEKEILSLSKKDPKNLPWDDLDVEVAVESTGVFRTKEKASSHLDAGADRVVISAPSHDEVTPTATPNVGEEALKEEKVTSNASCTTNATTPVASIMKDSIGIEKAMLTTVHGYTASQSIVDSFNDDMRRGRAGAENIVPSHTGSAVATGRCIPEMQNIFDGIAMRVPVPAGSIVDFTFVASEETSVEEINNIFRDASQSEEWDGIVGVTEDEIVSFDIVGQEYGSIVDLNFTRVVDGNLVKVVSWYDNEWGYSAMMLKHVINVSKFD